MKRFAKLFFTTLMATLFVALCTTKAFAAIDYPTSRIVYLSSANSTGNLAISVSGFAKGKGVVKSSVKSSNTSVVTAHTLSKSSSEATKLAKDGYNSKYYYDYIELTLKKPGTAKVSYKVGSKSCSTTVKVLKYTNPIKTLTITGVNGGKNLASKFNTSSYVNGKGGKKTGKITVAAKSGWKIRSISYQDSKYAKYWSHSISGGAAKATLSIPVKITGGHVSVDFVNTKTGGMLYASYNMN